METYEIEAAAALFNIAPTEKNISAYIQNKFKTEFLYEAFLKTLASKINLSFDLSSADPDPSGPSCSLMEESGPLQLLLTDDGLHICENSAEAGNLMAGIYDITIFDEYVNLLNSLIAESQDTVQVLTKWDRKHKAG